MTVFESGPPVRSSPVILPVTPLSISPAVPPRSRIYSTNKQYNSFFLNRAAVTFKFACLVSEIAFPPCDMWPWTPLPQLSKPSSSSLTLRGIASCPRAWATNYVVRSHCRVLLSGPILTNTCSRPYSRAPDIEQEVRITGFDAFSRPLSCEEVNIDLVTCVCYIRYIHTYLVLPGRAPIGMYHRHVRELRIGQQAIASPRPSQSA